MKNTGPVNLCLMTIHAHPDDESSKGAGSVAKASQEGIRTVLVTATGGEEGDILNPSLDYEKTKADIANIRAKELDLAAEIIGFDKIYRLGYRDSGMAGSEANGNPECFANAPIDEAVGKLVEIIRLERPDVIITYGSDQQGYPHPDHLKVHEISVPAFYAAADPEKYPEFGEVHTPKKLYYSVWRRTRFEEMHKKFLELSLESPFDEKWLNRTESEVDTTTTSIDVSKFTHVRRNALLAHATQIDPNSKFWFGLPPEVMDNIYPFDDYHLAIDLTQNTVDSKKSNEPDDELENDLFSGVR
ncbi:MAG: mycothiol conjugate amidase Mca [Acidimicrobiales bacterium]|nr:mycothiol conjugate amidase Mca [Acidimicrobiales bacterium]